MEWYTYLAIFLIPLIFVFQNPILSITGFDTFSTGGSGEGEFVIGEGQQGSGFTGVPETVEVPSETGDGAVSGGGVFLTLEGVKIIPANFNLRGSVGVNFSAKIYLKNEENSSLKIDFDSRNLGDIIEFDEDSIVINPNEERIIEFNIFPPEIPDIYTGDITLTSSNERAEIPFTIRVVSEISLFDILLDLPEKIRHGTNLRGRVTLTQAGLDEKEDVAVSYEIADSSGNIVFSEIETLAVQGAKTFEREFKTDEFELGAYNFRGEVIYSGGTAFASKRFEIVESGFEAGLFMYYLLIAMLITAIGIVSVIMYRVSRDEKLSEYKSLLSQIPR